jgi:hypothetical protein
MNTPINIALPTVKIPDSNTTEDKIAKSVEKPNAFSKPASAKDKGTRIRPGNFKDRAPRRSRKRDPRYVRYY